MSFMTGTLARGRLTDNRSPGTWLRNLIGSTAKGTKPLTIQKRSKVVLAAIGIVTLGVVGIILFLAQRTREQGRSSGGGNEIILDADGDLQAALKSAKFGDTIVLPAGVTYSGPFLLPYKGAGSGTDADYITIRTSDLGGISKVGDRIKPRLHARAMPKIVSTNQYAIGTEPRAHHYRFIGIEFSPADNSKYVYNLVDLGASDYNSDSLFPHHLIFDRCYVHSTGLGKARRGFALNSAETSIINSHVSGFAGEGDETQAIAGWNGPGPFHIINNYLEGGAEVLIFGGADPSIPNLIPSDIEIRRNYFYRPPEWAGKVTIKGSFELKNARRVIVDGNVFESTNPRQTALVITVRNQSGKAAWSTIQDVEITNNLSRHANAGMNFLGKDDQFPSGEAKNIRVANNLFVDVESPGESTYFIQISGGDSLIVEHNTVQQIGNILSVYGNPGKNFVFRNNIIQYNSYGIACFIQGAACPDVPYCNCLPGAIVKGNIIADNANQSASNQIEKSLPVGNFFVPSYDQLGFVDYARGNWRLSANNRYRRKGTDGKDPGIDFAIFEASGVNYAVQGSK
jgi:hypothetical protein